MGIPVVSISIQLRIGLVDRGGSPERLVPALNHNQMDRRGHPILTAVDLAHAGQADGLSVVYAGTEPAIKGLERSLDQNYDEGCNTA